MLLIHEFVSPQAIEVYLFCSSCLTGSKAICVEARCEAMLLSFPVVRKFVKISAASIILYIVKIHVTIVQKEAALYSCRNELHAVRSAILLAVRFGQL